MPIRSHTSELWLPERGLAAGHSFCSDAEPCKEMFNAIRHFYTISLQLSFLLHVEVSPRSSWMSPWPPTWSTTR